MQGCNFRHGLDEDSFCAGGHPDYVFCAGKLFVGCSLMNNYKLALEPEGTRKIQRGLCAGSAVEIKQRLQSQLGGCFQLLQDTAGIGPSPVGGYATEVRGLCPLIFSC